MHSSNAVTISNGHQEAPAIRSQRGCHRFAPYRNPAQFLASPHIEHADVVVEAVADVETLPIGARHGRQGRVSDGDGLQKLPRALFEDQDLRAQRLSLLRRLHELLLELADISEIVPEVSS